MPTTTPQEFADRWQGNRRTERSASQEHFLDLCAMLGQKTPSEVDPEGESFTFEKGVGKTGGGKGFADVWYRGRFAWEYKGRHKDLSAAYGQLLLYREDLGNPPLLVVSDMDRFEVHTNFTDTVKQVYSFSTAELPDPENLRVLRALFEDPEALRPGRTAESVTAEAAEKFARLADGLRSRGEDPRRAAHFLNKLLFCLFAEDVGLLPEGLFGRVVERTRREPARFAQYAGDLFTAMSAGGDFLLEEIPNFDGGLFADGDTLPLKPSELGILAAAARLDWGSVEPAIFGTLFERSLDPAQRSQLGAHYTSREDILAVVEPVLMAPLRREWEAVRQETGSLYDRQQEGGRSAARKRGDQRKIEAGISGFVERLREVRVLDPACGSGNFLYVSLRQLLNLEKEVSAFAGKVGLNPFFPGVSPEQLHGIETNPYAHELTQVSVWIGYLQWMVENGFGTRQEPILGPMTNILNLDAVVERRDGEVREPEWPAADVIIGNPPFLGGNKIRQELGGDYVEDLFNLYENRVPAFADFVCYWFEKARAKIRSGNTTRAGLLATQAIRGGANRRVLERIREYGNIFFAESDRPWILNGAAVHVSMVGFDDGSETDRTLDGAPVENIYSDLTGDLDLSTARVLRENRLIQFEGTKKGAAFDVSYEVARCMLQAPVNPNGRPNSDVVRPWANGLDITRRSRNMWILDFGADMPLEEAALYEMPFQHVETHVKPKYGATRKKWWLHERPRVEMRNALDGLSRYLATARVAKHRLFVWLDAATLPDSQVIAFARDDDYFFGVLHSQAHEVWARRTGTQLRDAESGFRYTPTTCFETFPFPEPSGEGRAEVAEAARELDAYRRNWLDP